MADPCALFRTPSTYADAAAKWVVENFDPRTIWEPCAGDGAICQALIRQGIDPATITATEKMADDRVERLSALGLGTIEIGDCADHNWSNYKLIITNPPFGYGIPIAEECLKRVALGGTVMLLNRLQWLAGQKRSRFFAKYPCSLLVLPWRESFVASGKTDCWDYGWMIWTVNMNGELDSPRIEWAELPNARS